MESGLAFNESYGSVADVTRMLFLEPDMTRFVLSLPLAASTPRADRLDEVVDYDFVRAVIAERVAQGHVGLQETLCDAIAERLIAHPQVRAVRVSTEKPDVYPDCAAVGVEVLRFKQENPS